MSTDDPKKTDPTMDELLGNLRSLFETERELVEEGRAIDAKLDRSAARHEAGQGEVRAHLLRLESLLEQVLDGQTRLNRRLDALEAQRTDALRVEDVLLRLLGTPSGGRLN